MKCRHPILILAILMLFGLALAGDEKPAATGTSEAKTALLNVKGMTCDGCASQVKSTLTSVSGVKECNVDWKSGKAEVRFEGDEAKVQELVTALNKTPFQASLANVTLAAATKAPPAQETTAPSTQSTAKAGKSKFFTKVGYQCSHCNITQEQTGKCPQCGMELSKVESTRTFVCAKDKYLSAEAGKCPACQAELVDYDVTFKCPTCEKTFALSGKCPEHKTTLKAVVDQPAQKLETKGKTEEPAKTM